MPSRSNKPYKEGELEVVLSLPPTADNIYGSSRLLDRSEEAIEIGYKIAFEHGPFAIAATVQQRKLTATKKRDGIGVGRQKAKPSRIRIA